MTIADVPPCPLSHGCTPGGEVALGGEDLGATCHLCLGSEGAATLGVVTLGVGCHDGVEVGLFVHVLTIGHRGGSGENGGHFAQLAH